MRVRHRVALELEDAEDGDEDRAADPAAAGPPGGREEEGGEDRCRFPEADREHVRELGEAEQNREADK